MDNHYCFTVTQYTYTDEYIVGADIVRKPNLSLQQALSELTQYVTEHPDCYATNDCILSEHKDKSIFGVLGNHEEWSAQISYNDKED